MIKLSLEVTPDICNMLLISIAGSQMQLEAIKQQIVKQGDEQTKPPEPQPAPAPVDDPKPEAPSADE